MISVLLAFVRTTLLNAVPENFKVVVWCMISLLSLHDAKMADALLFDFIQLS